MDMPDDQGKIVRQRMNYEQLEKTFNDLREEKAKFLGEKAELLKEPTGAGEEARRLSEEPGQLVAAKSD